MQAVTSLQLKRLNHKMQLLLERVEKCREQSVRHKICELYYLQKVREFELLTRHFTVAKLTLGNRQMYGNYQRAFCQWRRDARWLNQFLLQRPIL